MPLDSTPSQGLTQGCVQIRSVQALVRQFLSAFAPRNMDRNNNQNKRKAADAVFANLPPALRAAARRHSIAPGALGPSAFLRFASGASGAATGASISMASIHAGQQSAGHAGRARFDDDEVYLTYQNYIQSEAMKLALRRATERIRGEVDTQLSALHVQREGSKDIGNGITKNLLTTAVLKNGSETLQTAREIILPSLHALELGEIGALNDSVKNNLNSLPCNKVKPVGVGNALDEFGKASEVCASVMNQYDAGFDSHGTLEIKNKVKAIVEKKLAVSSELESLADMKKEAQIAVFERGASFVDCNM